AVAGVETEQPPGDLEAGSTGDRDPIVVLLQLTDAEDDGGGIASLDRAQRVARGLPGNGRLLFEYAAQARRPWIRRRVVADIVRLIDEMAPVVKGGSDGRAGETQVDKGQP